MTKTDLHILSLLLKGHFLRQQKRGRKTVYVIYDEKVNPIRRVKTNFIRSMDRRVPTEIELWKFNRNRDITLNLSMVRRLHGNNLIKRLYKKRNELEIISTINRRKPSQKNIQANEKILYLF